MSGTSSLGPVFSSVIANPDACSIKRLAWAYGCAPKGSQEELYLEKALVKRAATEVTAEIEERALSWSSVAVEALDRVDQLEDEVESAVSARALAESRSNNLDASHAARDATKLRISARLGLPATATQEEIADALDRIAALATERDAARAECERLRAQLAETSKLLETECSLSTNTTNAMLKAQAERNSARGDQHATIARLHAMLATEPAVSEERCGTVAQMHERGDLHRVDIHVPALIGAARQLHALRAGLREILGGGG